MSQAGKFIPGGAGRKTVKVPAPIRGPERPGGDGPKKENRLLSKGAGLTKQVPKKQRLPILIMSGLVCCMLVSIAWYEFGVLPVRRALALEHQKEDSEQKQLADLAAQKAAAAAAAAAPAANAILIVNSNPAGSATIGDETKATPATFAHLLPGKVGLFIRSTGFEDYRQELTVTGGKVTDLGTIQLTQALGTVALSSAQKDVTYTLTGPGGYTHDGQTPDKLADLPIGTYQLSVRQHDWQLPPTTLVLHDHETVQKDIQFPYGTLSVTTTPPGATVRLVNNIIGQTPLHLAQVRPGEMNLSVDLPPYTVQRMTISIPEGGDISKQITLQQDKDFIAACGMPMVWIPDGYWAGKYDVTQRVFETVTNYNPSSFRRPSRPVETVTWEEATAFCEKLNQYEERAGKLPKGFRYTLPTEAQWEAFSADADIDLAATSRTATLSSTADVGASEPNKYGLYDTLGNVWEWCLDTMDQSGAHSLRGGSWLSSPEDFPNAETRTAGAAKYADRFTGFRVVLVPQ